MRPRFLLFVPLLLLSTISRADTVSNFNLTGSSIFYGMGGDFNTVSGNVTIDVTTGVVQAISLTAGGLFQTGVDSQSGPVVYFGSRIEKISFDAGSLINFAGGAFDLNSGTDLYVGHVTAPAAVAPLATPEPASILLLGTGLLTMTALLRWRMHREA